ncbi:MAG: hypothetical protein JO078_05445 [Candidatus Eremiobacteraeota bacterium]|nr:hypothetical protein [Candidatus Eremiobacteraeota bacterium]MBV9699552.1 hypothetical protein [Candidatus Eremiobacteraeota bacterium]
MSLRRMNGSEAALSQRIGEPQNAQRFTVNLSAEIGAELRDIATTHRVSESSVVEIALRHLFRRVSAPALGTFLRERGACLRRRA